MNNQSNQIINHQCHPQIIQNIFLSNKIYIGQTGLYAKQQLQPNQIILSVQQKYTFCYSTIPSSFKNKLNYLQGIIIQCQTQIPKKIQLKSQLLVIYLIHLKTININNILYNWLNRPINGLYYFNRKIIQQTQNLDLLINYIALQNHLNSFTKSIYHLLQSNNTLSFITNQINCTYTIFKQLYIWSYHFINSRSFGYTDQYTLIPIFDMMNHSSNNDNVQQIITSSPNIPNSINQLRSQLYKQQQTYKSDNDSQQQQNTNHHHHPSNKTNNFLELYYHVIPVTTILQNQQLLIKYGKRNNMFLLQGYGFTQQFNQYQTLITYFNTNNKQIYYDSIKGSTSIKIKFKRYYFDFNILIQFKKYYYYQFYHQSSKNIKSIWSIPKNKQFQIYFLTQIIQRMIAYPPKIHYFSKLTGDHQLTIWQKQRKAIFDCNLYFFYILYKSICTQKDQFQSKLQNQYKLGSQQKTPKSIIQYAELLKKLNNS